MTIDCPVDCGYLIAAHRYELKQNKPLPVAEVPFPDVEVPRDLIHLNRSLVSGLAFAILKCATETPSANDVDVLAALQALAEKFRTLGSGIYYEKPPAGGPPQAVYAALDKFVEDFKQQLAQQGGPARLKDTDIFHFLVFLFALGASKQMDVHDHAHIWNFCAANSLKGPQRRNPQHRVLSFPRFRFPCSFASNSPSSLSFNSL